MTGATLKRILFFLSLILLPLIVFQPVYLFHESSYNAPSSKGSRYLDADYRVIENGSVISRSLPFYSLSFFKGGGYSVEFSLPVVRDGEALAFQTRGCGLRVYVDGEEIYSYVYPGGYAYPSVRMYHSVPLYDRYSGSSVLVEYEGGASGPLMFEICVPVIGNTSSNYHYFFDPYKWPSVLLISMISLGVMLLILSFLLKGEKRRKFLIFSLFVLDITLTIFLESLLSELLIGNPLFSSLSAVFLRTLTPFLCLLLLRSNFSDIKEFAPYSFLSSLAACITLLFPVFSLLSFFRLADFSMIYLLLEPCTIIFLTVASIPLFRFKSKKTGIYLIIMLLFLIKNFLRLMLAPFLSEGVVFDVVNIILSSVSFIICVFDAVRTYAEENEMIVNINAVLSKSHIDSLSGLENVNSFKLYLEKMKEERGCYYVMFFDLDGLKAVNDSQGHLRGDELIRDFGCVVKERVSDGISAFRIGGDEFIVIIEGGKDGEKILSSIVSKYEAMDERYGVSGMGDVLDLSLDPDIAAFFKKLDGKVLRMKREKNENR